MSSHEMVSQAMFFLLAAVIVGSSIAMLFNRNFVHSTVFLAAALLSFAGLYALLEATFLATLQLFIYAGAVTVVVVFVVMLTRVEVGTYSGLLQRQTWLAAIVVVAFSIPLVEALVSLSSEMPTPPVKTATTSQLAVELLTKQAAPFEIASVVLLAALVGAIYLAKEAE